MKHILKLIFFLSQGLLAQSVTILTPSNEQLEQLQEKLGDQYADYYQDLSRGSNDIRSMSARFNIEVKTGISDEHTARKWTVIAEHPNKESMEFSPVDFYQFYDFFLPELLFGLWEQQTNLDKNYPCPDLLEFKQDSLIVWNECQDTFDNIVSTSQFEIEYSQLNLSDSSTYNQFYVDRLTSDVVTLKKGDKSIAFRRK